MIATSSGRLSSVALCGLFICLPATITAQTQTTPSPAGSGTGTPVILISIDTLRADRLSCYGYRGMRTPNIDSLARRGTLFSAVSSLAPLTLPSHVSLLTSTYPFFNGVEDNGEQLRREVVTLATVLRGRGYRTAAFVGGFVLDRRFGLNEGFDFYDSPFDLHGHEGMDPGDIKRLGREVIAVASQWLAENASHPFFIFIHLYDLHTPYNLPPSYRARLQGLSGYEAELGYVDDLLGNFWKLLEQPDLLDKTLIVFTSDHGEGLGDHSESSHGYFIYQSTIWVPLIVRWPAGTAPFPARVNEPVSLIDVAPTILKFLGVQQPVQFQGRSLLRLLKGGPSGRGEEIYSESEYGHRHFGVSGLRSLRVGNYKYIEAPKPELYNLAEDPGETRNLYQRQRSLALSLRQPLLSFRSRFGTPNATEVAQTPSPEVIERLRSLGYVTASSNRSDAAAPGPDPKDRIAEWEQYGRALMLSYFGRIDEANVALERLLAKFPGLIDVSICLGFNKERQGHYAEAVEVFKRVLKQDPLNAVAHFDLAVNYYALRKLDEASRELEATLAIAPYYTRAEELLGTILFEKGNHTGARAHFAEILKFAPDDYAAHVKLGVIATMQSQWTEAELHLKSALKTDPESAEAHNTLGSVYLYRGDMDQAAAEFADAIRLDPKFAVAHYNLGLVRAKQGRKAEAAREFQAALSADPKFRAAQEALARLEGRAQ